MNKIRKQLGILRSKAMYYWKPFNQRRLVHFYQDFIKEGDLCFDIGAHLGNRIKAWNALGAKTIALEPQPSCLAFLEKKFGNNPQVKIIPKAVSNQMGKTKMFVSTLTPTVSTLSDDDWKEKIDAKAKNYTVHWDEEIEVELTTLDALIAEFGIPAFCKIDVEDLEKQVLEGLSQAIPSLSYEYYAPCVDRAIDCIHILAELGSYEYNYSYGESQVLNAQTWLSKEKILEVLSKVNFDSKSGDIYARLK